METEFITDKQIKMQALQHLLIYYENLSRKTKRDDIVDTSERYIAKIRRTIIRMMEEPAVVEVDYKPETYK